MVEGIFWTAGGLILYTYLGYPLVIAWLARRRPAPPPPEPPSAWPSVAIVIAAHNERQRLPRKFASLARVDYPRHLMRIYCVSDGSSDGTAEYIANHPGIHPIILPERQGKPTALNAALEMVTEDIVVFTDGRQPLEPDAVRILVARLLEPGVGAVSGELCHLEPSSGTAEQVGLYWRYEKWIRRNESRYHSVPGVSGALYAIRRSDFRPLAPDTILDDFEIPMAILRSGGRILLEPGARAYDTLNDSPGAERARKIRTLCGNFQSIQRNPWLLDPRQNPIWWQWTSHKFLRLLIPYMLVAAYLTAGLATGPVYTILFWGQSMFYAAAATGMLVIRTRRWRVVSFAAVFTELNLSAVLALWRFVSGHADVRWKKV